jgi:hypothetical protein
LFLLSAIGGGVAWYLTMRAAQNALAAVSAAASPIAPPTSPGAAPTSSPDSGGVALSGACAKAAECCKKIVQKSNAGQQAETACQAMKQLTDATCAQPLQTYRQSAKLLGVSCD